MWRSVGCTGGVLGPDFGAQGLAGVERGHCIWISQRRRGSRWTHGLGDSRHGIALCMEQGPLRQPSGAGAGRWGGLLGVSWVKRLETFLAWAFFRGTEVTAWVTFTQGDRGITIGGFSSAQSCVLWGMLRGYLLFGEGGLQRIVQGDSQKSIPTHGTLSIIRQENDNTHDNRGQVSAQGQVSLNIEACPATKMVSSKARE